MGDGGPPVVARPGVTSPPPETDPARGMTGGGAAAPVHRMGGPQFPRAAGLALVAVLAIVTFAPGTSNFFWGVGGLREASPLAWMALGLGALAAAAWSLGAPLPFATLILLGLVTLVGPWRESGHLLGDTYVRQRALELAERGGAIASFREFGRLMHAQPLDNLLGVWGPAVLTRLGVRIAVSQAVVGAGLASAWFWIARTTVRRVAPAASSALAVALVVGGSLEVLTGYAESGGVLLVCGAFWWSRMLAPVDSPRRAALVVFAWLVLAAAHRVALVAVVPQLLRAYVIRLPGDDDRLRRWIGVGTLLALAAGALVGGAGVREVLAQDFTELLATLRRFMPLHDVLNLVAVVAPLALLAPMVVGLRGLREAFRSPRGRLHAAALVPMLPLVFVFPMAPHGLGAHRDWELAIMPGWIASSLAVTVLATLEPRRLRGALALLLPAQLLLAAAWLVPNADAGATHARAVALVHGPGRVRWEARAHACTYLGYRAADAGADRESAEWFDESFASLANPRTALLAAESWLRAGDAAAAGRSLQRARECGNLPTALEAAADRLQRAIELESSDGFRNAAP